MVHSLDESGPLLFLPPVIFILTGGMCNALYYNALYSSKDCEVLCSSLAVYVLTSPDITVLVKFLMNFKINLMQIKINLMQIKINLMQIKINLMKAKISKTIGGN